MTTPIFRIERIADPFIANQSSIELAGTALLQSDGSPVDISAMLLVVVAAGNPSYAAFQTGNGNTFTLNADGTWSAIIAANNAASIYRGRRTPIHVFLSNDSFSTRNICAICYASTFDVTLPFLVAS